MFRKPNCSPASSQVESVNGSISFIPVIARYMPGEEVLLIIVLGASYIGIKQLKEGKELEVTNT